ncbi:Eco57I restriction-modification methylase domain-containing protein [Helicobacter canis]|uniref:site-specific DNA-methyltransferase (adenine-specific) n=1 Tax=Helicobacter canis TaxID=29419 RepID=A0A377J7W7_9HELI|nr:Eco57I restriction-modification methylase domain-containing protein [Helicobacter canis]STO97883.1 type II restriction-modification enzyme [Helicobacter canis]
MTTPLQTFTTSPYTLEHFKDFIQQAFPQAQLLDSPTTPYKEGHIIHAYTPICDEIELESSHILQVYAFETSSTRAKVTLHQELAKIAKDNASHILACFYDPSDTKEFRLSLITTGFDFEANKSTHSNLRRQSFTLGDSIPTHTAQKQLKDLIDSKAKSKDTLEEVFSLEPVTKEFYAEYKKLYDSLCQTLNASPAVINALNGYQGASGEQATSAFVKKLLGRIIFLYFLQKKGWLGVEQGKQWGSGDKHFFRTLFARAKKQGQSFYAKLLCPLFFESLNTKRQGDYSQELGCKIPFLNGGLFEEAKLPATEHHSFDRHIAIEQALDNTQFEAIFELFDRYHFTIEESTPDNVEISIDPEMLGKVFENLIDYNKDTGAFYTRRPIVHFMCKNALTRYLQIQLLGSIAQADLSDSSAKVDSRKTAQCPESTFDKTAQNASDSHDIKVENVFDNHAADSRKSAAKPTPEISQAIHNLIFHQDPSHLPQTTQSQILSLLQECTILDNAIGSGAFPMGLLLEILEAIHALCPELKEEQLAAHKRQIIANQIYGVDIDADAIEIAKLRFWLSIAVDESSPSPLPNLDFKLMQGNSLLESICGIPVLPRLASHLEQPQTLLDTNEQLKRDYGKPQERTLLDSTAAQKLEAIFLDYYESHTPKQKQALKQEILSLLRQATDKEIAYKQDQIDNLLKNATPKTMQKAQAQAQAKSLALEDFKAELDSLLHDYARYDFHTDKLFLYRFFFAPVFEKGGFDIVIGNPPYIRQEKIPQKQEILQEFEALRLEPQAPIKFSDSSADIFTYFYAKGLELLKPSGVLSFITSNKWCRAKYGQNLRELLLPRLDSHYDLNGIKAFESATVDTAITTVLKSQPQTLKDQEPKEAKGSKESKAPSHNLYFLALSQSGASHQALLSSSPYLSATIHTKRVSLPASSLSASSLSFANPAALALKAKIEAIGTPLKEWDISINYGIKTGYNEAFIIDSHKRDEILSNCDDTQASLKPYPLSQYDPNLASD